MACSFIILALCGIHLNIGLAIHPSHYDDPEIHGLKSPLGVVELTLDVTDRVSLFATHVSSTLVDEYGFGLNMVGIKLKVF